MTLAEMERLIKSLEKRVQDLEGQPREFHYPNQPVRPEYPSESERLRPCPITY